MAVIVLFVISVQEILLQEQRYRMEQEISIRSILSENITPENSKKILAALPESLKIANNNKREGKIEQAIEDYRTIMMICNKIIEEIGVNPQGFSTIVSWTDQLQSILTSAELSLAELIKEKRLPLLKTQLNRKDFGSQVDSDFSQYKGALGTTYSILMGSSGIRADQNSDGILNEGEENALPCDTLKEIEQLWRNSTNDRCGWYGSKDILEPKCIELKGKTLRSILMYPPALPEFEKRLKQCSIDFIK